MAKVTKTNDGIRIELSMDEARKLVSKLEWAAIWDKVGDVYYGLAKILKEHGDYSEE